MGENEILDTSLALEKKDGVITIFSVVEHPPFKNKSFEVLFPDTFDYLKAIEIAEVLRQKGKPIEAVDMLIAAMCINRNSILLTKDNHFRIVKEYFSEFELKSI